MFFSALLGCSANPATSEAAPVPIAKAHLCALETPSAAALAPEAPPRLEPLPPSEPPLEPLPAGTTVLHVGSSSAGAMGPALNKELEAHGVRGVLKFKQSTFIRQWAGEEMGLRRYIAQYDPHLVLVSLGGNEVSIPDPTRLSGSIERLVAAIGDRPCVWVGTPRWKKLQHTGLLEVIRDHAVPCRFIDTDELAPDMKPAKDGVHPTMSERRRWARRVLQWLQVNRNPDGEHPWSFRAETVIPEDPDAETAPEPIQGASPAALPAASAIE